MLSKCCHPNFPVSEDFVQNTGVRGHWLTERARRGKGSREYNSLYVCIFCSRRKKKSVCSSLHFFVRPADN